MQAVAYFFASFNLTQADHLRGGRRGKDQGAEKREKGKRDAQKSETEKEEEPKKEKEGIRRV